MNKGVGEGNVLRRLLSLGGLLGALLAAFVLLPGLPASAATRDGWVRVAHMSPDTAAVNVTVSTLNEERVLLRLGDVKYGAVSKYVRLPAGRYALSMQPSSGGFDAPVIVSRTITVAAGQARTVMAYNLNDDLKTKVINDKLGDPGNGKARVRVVQAVASPGDVSAKIDDTTLLSSESIGTVGAYKSVAAGTQAVALTSSGTANKTVDVSLKAGTTYTIFALNRGENDLDVVKAVDSSASAITPKGSVAAGYGGMAQDGENLAGVLALVAALAGVSVGALMVRRRVTS